MTNRAKRKRIGRRIVQVHEIPHYLQSVPGSEEVP